MRKRESFLRLRDEEVRERDRQTLGTGEGLGSGTLKMDEGLWPHVGGLQPLKPGTIPP